MSQIVIEDKTVVAPGELLAEGMDYLPGTGAYRKDDKIYANRVGLVSINGRAIKLIPLCGTYNPKRDDIIIGQVSDITPNGWRIDTFTLLNGLLNVRDATTTYIGKNTNLSRILAIGDFVAVKVFSLYGGKSLDLSMRGNGLKKLVGGQILQYSPHKFPRIIGRAGSMVSMIKRATNCQILVGQNGYIWINGEPEMEVVAREAIEMIEAKAHVSGLTDQVKQFLKSKCPDMPDEEPEEEKNDVQEEN